MIIFIEIINYNKQLIEWVPIKKIYNILLIGQGGIVVYCHPKLVLLYRLWKRNLQNQGKIEV